MATAEVILREKIENLGAESDVVKVKAGYARNYLIPQGKAYEATKANLRHVEALKQARVQREADELKAAETLAGKLKKHKPTFTLETGQGGKAFGSITNIDIHKDLEAAGFDIDRHSIDLKKPIKGSGKFPVTIKLHPDVSVTLNVNVKAEGTEEEA